MEEEVAELGQQALERYAAGLTVDPRDEEAMDEYIEVMLSVLPVAFGFGAAGQGVSSIQRRRGLGLEKETGSPESGISMISRVRTPLRDSKNSTST